MHKSQISHLHVNMRTSTWVAITHSLFNTSSLTRSWLPVERHVLCTTTPNLGERGIAKSQQNGQHKQFDYNQILTMTGRFRSP